MGKSKTKDITLNDDGSVLISKAVWEEVKALVIQETGEDPDVPGMGFINLAELLELEHLIPEIE